MEWHNSDAFRWLSWVVLDVYSTEYRHTPTDLQADLELDAGLRYTGHETLR